MKYVFIAAHEGEYAVKRMCKVLEVQRSGYYAWRKRKPSTREQANQVLLALIEAEHARSRAEKARSSLRA
jgi:acyl-CoA-binding protein